MKPKRLTLILAAIPILLLIPLIAMQFTSEVYWDETDFIVMSLLLLAVGLGLEIVLRKVKTNKKRLLWIGIVFFLFILIWGELAVGIFGTPFAGS
ncbi:MAG: hypothetical protein WD530_01925 [Vicingaceae bacterium]